MKLLALPAFTDNYIWMISDGRQALVVDPGDATPVLQALQDHQLSLAAILVTHRHLDHTGGLAALRPVLQGPVYGPRHEAIDGLDIPVGEGDRFEALGLQFETWDTPGHTAGHVSYLALPAQGMPWPQTLVFCGDTLFSAGCGRLFDGTAEQLLHSLDRLAALPADTWLCPTHEYTVSNLRFASAADPGNPDVAEALNQSLALRARGEFTLPTQVARERQINPFLRCRQPTVVAQALKQGAPDASALSVFTTLRQWKNHYPA
jgi:hydroxyacylglutathione hydrolase